MKRYVAFVVLILVILSLFSCERNEDPYNLLSEFLGIYDAKGIVYSPTISEGDEGYIPEGFVEKLYVFYGKFPENFALFLNSHPSYSYECGVFDCQSSDEVRKVEEACLERIRLLSASDRSFIIIKDNIVFYSTLKDRERAEKIWREIIR